MDLSPWRIRPPFMPARFWLPADPSAPATYAAQLHLVPCGTRLAPDIRIGWVVRRPDGQEAGRGEEDTSAEAQAAADAALTLLPAPPGLGGAPARGPGRSW
jgi:hypothetical protein